MCIISGKIQKKVQYLVFVDKIKNLQKMLDATLLL